MSHDDDVELILTLEEEGQYDRALAVCEMLHARAPDEPFVAHMLGTLHLHRGETDQATEHLARAVQAEPGAAAYRQRYADALRAAGRPADAAEHYRKAADLDPAFAGARLRAAQCLMDAGARDEALAEIDAAAGGGANADVVGVAARLHLDAGDNAGALDRARAVLEADPSHAACRRIAVTALTAAGDIEGAAAELRRAFDGGLAGAEAAMLARAVLPRVAPSRAALDRARAAYEEAVERLETVEARAELAELANHNTNFVASYQGVDDAPFQRRIAAFYERICPALSEPRSLAPAADGDERLRIGFVSTNFYNHTVGKLFRGLIAELDRARFEVHVFATRPPSDDVGRFLAGNCDRFHHLPDMLGRARKVLAEARLDILFYPDIGMDVLTYFLAFQRLAPLQCVGWGHPVTTGIPAVDLFISSTDLETGADAQVRYSEELVRLAHPPTYLYQPPAPPADAAPDLGPELGEHADGGLYVCPQSLFKIHPDFDRLLAGILARDPGGRAIFLDGQPGWADVLKARWKGAIPDVENRVRFVPRMGVGAFFGLLEKADAILDTVHFSGGMTSAEALALGKAVVTWPGELMPGRVTYAYCRQMGVEESCVGSAEEYVETAVRLGSDADYRTRLEARLRDKAAKLWRCEAVVRELEDVLETAYRARAES